MTSPESFLLRPLTDLTDQCRMLECLASMDPQGQVDWLPKFAGRLQIAPERLAQILNLETTIDRRMALRANTRWPAPRMPGEEIYPTDGWLGSYLEWSGVTFAPTAFNFWSGVAALHAACRRSVYCWGNGRPDPLYLNQYFMLVGNSGCGKSTAINLAKSMVTNANKFIPMRSGGVHDLRVKVWTDGSPEALLTELAEGTQVREPEEGKPAWKPRPDSSCFIVKDELVALVGRQEFGSQRLMSRLLDIYDSPERLEDKKEIRKRLVERVAVTLLGGVPPDILFNSFDSTMFTGGMLSRVIVVYREASNRLKSQSQVADPIHREHLAEQLAAIAVLPQDTELALDDSADKWLREFSDEMEHESKTAHGRLEGWYSRLPSHVMKTAAALALSNGQWRAEGRSILQVTEAEVRLAYKLIDSERQGLAHLMERIPSKDPSARVEDVYRAIVQEGEISRTKLMRVVQPYVQNAKMLDEVVDMLEAQGRIKKARRVEGKGASAHATMFYWPSYKEE